MAVFRYRQDAAYISSLMAGLSDTSSMRRDFSKALRDVMFPYLSGQEEDFSKRAKRLMENAIAQGPIRFAPVELPQRGAIDVNSYRSHAKT